MIWKKWAFLNIIASYVGGSILFSGVPEQLLFGVSQESLQSRLILSQARINDNEAVEIVEATMNDLDDILNLRKKHFEYSLKFGAMPYPSSMMRHTYEKVLRGEYPYAKIYITVRNGEIIGFVLVGGEGADHVSVTEIVVMPSFRKKDIGTALFGTGLNYLKSIPSVERIGMDDSSKDGITGKIALKFGFTTGTDRVYLYFPKMEAAL